MAKLRSRPPRLTDPKWIQVSFGSVVGGFMDSARSVIIGQWSDLG